MCMVILGAYAYTNVRVHVDICTLMTWFSSCDHRNVMCFHCVVCMHNSASFPFLLPSLPPFFLQAPLEVAISSTGPQLLLYFYTDVRKEADGFEISYW